MFEYLMPLLVMPSYRGTLLDRACKTAVELQIEYGNSHGVPWGVSESAFNQGDAHQIYQYRAFGVPGLGLKRGLAEDLVIAPYALGAGVAGSAAGSTASICSAWPAMDAKALTDFTRQSIIHHRVCRRMRAASPFALTWRIIRE